MNHLGIAVIAGLLVMLASMASVELGVSEEAREQIGEFFHRITKEAKDMAGLAGVELETEVRPGHSNIFGRIMGSTAGNLSRLAPCSVLIVK